MRFLPRPWSFATLLPLLALAGCAADPSVGERRTRLGEDESAATAASAASRDAGGPAVPMGRVGSHGMVLFGKGSLYLSHIPMYGRPHDVQLVMKASFVTAPAPNALPATFSDQLYTFVPQRLSLDALRLGALTRIQGTIFLGNFEQGGRPLADASLNIDQVLVNRVLTANAPTAQSLPYFAFGTPGEAYVVHPLEAAPSFDQVSTIRFGNRAPGAAALAQGLALTVTGAANRVAARLDGSALVVEDASGAAFDLAGASELSCLVGPDFVDPCP